MIVPIEGYIVSCDRCGREEVFYENAEYYTGLEVDRFLYDFLEDLESKGWQIGEDGEALCPDCKEEEQ